MSNKQVTMTARCRVSHCHSILGPRTLFHKSTLTPGVATTPNEADSGTIVRAKILNNDSSVSSNVVKAGRALGLRLEVGDVIGVAPSADTNEVCRILDTI